MGLKKGEMMRMIAEINRMGRQPKMSETTTSSMKDFINIIR